MEKSNLHTNPYQFKNTSPLDGINYRWISKANLKKAGVYKVQDSFTSNVVDLNETKRIGLIVHFHTIKKAIEYAKRQYLEGVSERMHIPLPELDKAYYHRVWMAAKRLAEYEKNGISKDAFYKASQPFWIDQLAILTYGFRQNKTLSSKFQAFVEFKNANRTQPSIKLNLQMSKQAYKHIDELYLDGFDLVQHNNSTYTVRHVRQTLVKPKEKTGIDKLIFVDKWLNLYSILVDRNGRNEYGHLYYDEENKTVNGYIRKTHKCSNLNRLFMALTNKVSPKRYQDILHRFEMSLKARLEREIGSSNEDNITLLLPEYHHKTANIINKMVHTIVKDLCIRQGLRLQTIVKTDTVLNDIVKQHKERLKHKFKTSHTKWQEYAYALMLLRYKGFYPYLRKSRKSSVKTTMYIPQKDVEEFTYDELVEMKEQLIQDAINNTGYECKSKDLLRRLGELEKEHQTPIFVDKEKLREYQFRRGLDLGFWSTREEFELTCPKQQVFTMPVSEIDEPEVQPSVEFV